jgi:hypothetical protein
MEVTKLDLNTPKDRSRYEALFDQCPYAFIQQSTYWSDTISEISPDAPFFLIASHNGQDVAGLPLYLFRSEYGNIITSVPHHGPLGGIFYLPTLSKDEIDLIYKNLLTFSLDLAYQYDCVALTIITSPFTEDRSLYERYMNPDVVFENFTQAMWMDRIFDGKEITLPDWRKKSSNMSRILRKGHDAGLLISVCKNEHDWNAWYAIHVQRQTELGVAPMPQIMVQNIFNKLFPKGKAHLLIAQKDSVIIGGILYIRHQKIMDTPAISMDANYKHLSPNYLITEYSVPWAASAGIEIYNWQSMANRQNGVYEFKKRWGGQERLYYFMTKLFKKPEHFLKVGKDALKKAYPNHYVIPFAAIDDNFSKQFYAKE